MITTVNSEKPMTMVVKQRRAVFRKTLPLSRVLKSPQKQAPRTAVRKNAAPVLYGRERTFTKNRST